MSEVFYFRQTILHHSFESKPYWYLAQAFGENFSIAWEGCSTTWRKPMQMQGNLCINAQQLRARNG